MRFVLLAALSALSAQVAPPVPVAPLPTPEQVAWHAAGMREVLGDGRARRVVGGAVLVDEVDVANWNFVEGSDAWTPALRVAPLPASLAATEDLYYDTVGRGANLSLEVPRDAGGRPRAADAERLAEFATLLEGTFDLDLLRGAAVRASNVRGRAPSYGPEAALDGDPDSYWATDDDTRVAFLDLDLGGARWLDRLRLEEPIALGQRVRSFRVEARVAGAWRVLARGSTIGARRLLRIEAVEATHLRVVIEDARACPLLSRVGAYLAPPRVSIETPDDVFLGSTRVTLACDLSAAIVRYTLDGSVPTEDAQRYEHPFVVDASVQLVARAFLGEEAGPVARRRLRGYTVETLREPVSAPVPPAPGWRVRAYAGEFVDPDDLADARVESERIVPTVDLAPRVAEGAGALVFEGVVNAREPGLYTFFVGGALDAGVRASRLSVGGEVLIAEERGAGTIGLGSGWHPVRVEVLHGPEAGGFELAWRGPKLARQPIAAADAGHL